MILTRQQYQEELNSLDLNRSKDRQLLSRIVIDEILDVRNIIDWDENPFINYSRTEYKRPCPKVIFGSNGWEIRFTENWFCD